MIWLMILCTVLAVLRPLPLIISDGEPEGLFGNKHYQQSFQAIAHIVVGILGTLWYNGINVADARCLLIFLTIIEVCCATVTILRKMK